MTFPVRPVWKDKHFVPTLLLSAAGALALIAALLMFAQNAREARIQNGISLKTTGLAAAVQGGRAGGIGSAPVACRAGEACLRNDSASAPTVVSSQPRIR